MRQFFGKYRGTVENNVDPQQRGRLQVSVPTVLGDGRSSWAMPCVAFAGPQVGLFALPPSGAYVWVEFEAGDPDYPIWTGCFWGQGEVPAVPAIEATKVLKTEAGSLTISDLPGAGGIVLETTLGMKISMTAQGIEITNGQGATISLTGFQVSVNGGALEVV
ncbi:MAG: phage baseplate assembly protein V [Cyanobacteria bacterium J06614_10]